MRVIQDVAEELGISAEGLMVYHDQMAKLRLPCLPSPGANLAGKIILVSAINPTRAGEGKTTVSIGLAQGMRRRGKKVALAWPLRIMTPSTLTRSFWIRSWGS